MNEFKKIFNLAKRYYITTQKSFPLFIRNKLEKALSYHLQKKLNEISKMTDPHQKLDILNDLVDFYLRYCNKESEHFNFIFQKIIDKYKHKIPEWVIEEKLQRKVDYN